MSYYVYTLQPQHSGACAFYRVIQPLTLMAQMGFPVQPILDDGVMTISNQQRSAMFLEVDISLMYQNISEFYVQLMRHSKSFSPMKDHDGEMHWPPTFVVDTDDDVFNVTPLSIAYGTLGIKRHDGTPLEKGGEVGIADPTHIAPPAIQEKLNALHKSPAPGEFATVGKNRYLWNDETQAWHPFFSLWRDGDNFNLAQNQARLSAFRETMAEAHLLTCSTPRAADYIRRELGPQANIFVTPNGVNFDDYPTIELRNHPKEVRILWEGGSSHHEGLWPLNDAMVRVAKRYPQAVFYFWGSPYKWAGRNLPNVRFVEWVGYDAYKLRASTIGHDISIAPLAKTTFNDSRSAIRWYESSVIWRPAPVLAQRWGAYQDEIEDGTTGLLFDTPEEFEQKLGALIESAALRKSLSANAKDWVRTHRDARKVTTALFHKWSEVREAHKQSIPVPAEPEVAVTPA